MSRSFAYSFTVNNPVSNTLAFPDWIEYAKWQLESGENGTRHLQGMIICNRDFRARTGARLSQLLFQAHWEKARDRNALHIYVGKEDTRLDGPWEHGIWTPAAPGARSDLARVQAAIDADPDITEQELYQNHFSVMLRYHDSVFNYRRIKQEAALGVEEFVLREGWQTDLDARLDDEPHPREIIWVCDLTGI